MATNPEEDREGLLESIRKVGDVMCLGVPGKVLSIEDDALGMRMGKVSFAGITKRVCMAYTPEAEVDDYVVVHVGFAISTLDEAEAAKVFEFLEEMDELGELELPQPETAQAPSRVERPPLREDLQ